MISINNKKTTVMLGIFVGIFIIVIGSALAFSVSSQYWKDYPLQISPGETKDIYVVLQNRAGTAEDLTATGTITQGSDIAKITGLKKEYEVPFGEETKVNIRVSIPKEVEVGHNYDITINFNFASATEGEGPLTIGSNVEKVIPVLVVAEPPKSSETEERNLWIYLIIGLIVLIILAVIIIIKVIKNKGLQKAKNKKSR